MHAVEFSRIGRTRLQALLGCRSGATCLTYPPDQTLSNRRNTQFQAPKSDQNHATRPTRNSRRETYNPSPTHTPLKQEQRVVLARRRSHVRPESTAAFRTFGVRIDTLRPPSPPVKTPPTRACRTTGCAQPPAKAGPPGPGAGMARVWQSGRRSITRPAASLHPGPLGQGEPLIEHGPSPEYEFNPQMGWKKNGRMRGVPGRLGA